LLWNEIFVCFAWVIETLIVLCLIHLQFHTKLIIKAIVYDNKAGLYLVFDKLIIRTINRKTGNFCLYWFFCIFAIIVQHFKWNFIDNLGVFPPGFCWRSSLIPVFFKLFVFCFNLSYFYFGFVGGTLPKFWPFLSFKTLRRHLVLLCVILQCLLWGKWSCSCIVCVFEGLCIGSN